MAFDELQSLVAAYQLAFELFVFNSRQDLLESRSRRESNRDEVITRDERLGPDVLVGPRITLAAGVGVVRKIFACRGCVNTCKVQVIFEPIEPKKPFETANGHLTNFGESGQVLDEGHYMMHLPTRKLQAFDDPFHIGDRRVVHQDSHCEVCR